MLDDCLKGTRVVDWEEVYDYYSLGELRKWHSHGAEAVGNHFRLVQQRLKALCWVRGRVTVADLFSVYMCPGPKWLPRLACPNHEEPECPYCTTTTPKLSEVIQNYSANAQAHPGVAGKIDGLQQLIRDGLVLTPHAIVVDDAGETVQPYVFDGNSRVIALAINPDWTHRDVFVYYGQARP